MQIKDKVKTTVRLSSLCIIGILATAIIYPSTSQLAQAADTPVTSGDDNLSVSISRTMLNLEADPGINNGIALGSITTSAKTTNETGYVMSLKANNTALRSADVSNITTVPALAGNTALTSFPANRWGYYFGTSEGTTDTTYLPVSTTAAKIDGTTVANSTARVSTLTIGAKIDNTLPADTYSTQLTVSVVGNPPSLSQLKYMQDVTSENCAFTPEGRETQLEDSRDGNVYWVGKMKDGRCWMLQNLALGKTSGATALTSANSSISGNWNLPASYPSATSGAKTATAIQSWNFGKWVLATPELAESCENTGNNENSGLSSVANCTKVGFVDVSDTTKFQPGYSATTSNWGGANATDNTLVAVNCTAWSGSGTSKKCTAGTYDAHYLVGNYYSWNAATAGTGDSITSGQATGSICPKGWKLPISNSTAVGSLAGLLSQYGVSSSLSGTVDGATYNIAGEPLRLVRGSCISPGYLLGNVGAVGQYWSSTSFSGSNTTYYMFFNRSNVVTSGYSARYVGLSLRCTAE